MATEIKMPQLGESVVEGTITKWLKKEGDAVSEDELLVEVSTDKVDSEIPSSASGTIQKILVEEGETVSVGAAIAVVGEDGEAAGSDDQEAEGGGDEAAEDDQGEDAQPAEAQSEPDEPEGEAEEGESQDEEGESQDEEGESQDEEEAPAAEAEGNGPEEEAKGRDDAGERREPSADQAVDRSGVASDTSKRGVISPLVRRLADEHDIDLTDVEGTGTGGRIRKQDVLAFVESEGKKRAQPSVEEAEAAEAPAASEAPAAAEPSAPERRPEPSEREELVPWTNIRRRTAEHMAASARETARAWNAVEVDWTRLVALRAKVKDAFRQREGFNLTYMGFLGRALCETLLEMPEVNATFDEENQGNLVKHYVNLGIAVALEGGGLIVPVVKGAEEKNLVGLARGINEVVTKARSKKLSPDDLSGGTFTITNPGPFGSIVSVPIIPRGQAAIVSFEAIKKSVVVTDDDALAIRSMGFLTLSWDHRIIDGAEASRFLSSLKERVETMDFSADLSHYL
jgi:pyruvate dehydrogenase E2 component (dihydrolipoamide acetyltransferase)